jgi:hypothetical protein
MRGAVARATVSTFGKPLIDLVAEAMVGSPSAPDFEGLLRRSDFAIYLDEQDIKSCHSEARQVHVCQTALFRLAQLGILDPPPVALITLAILEVAVSACLPGKRSKEDKNVWYSATVAGCIDSLHGAAASGRFRIENGCLQANSHDRHLHNQESIKEPEDGEVADYESKSDWHTKGTRNTEYSYRRALPDIVMGSRRLTAEVQRHITLYDKSAAGKCGPIPCV